MNEYVHWLLESLLTALAVMGWWMWRKLVGSVSRLGQRIKEVEDAAHQTRLDQKDILMAIDRLRLHVTENYASKPETSAALQRVHDKIEEMSEGVSDKIDNLRRDIKQDIRDAFIGNGRPQP